MNKGTARKRTDKKQKANLKLNTSATELRKDTSVNKSLTGTPTPTPTPTESKKDFSFGKTKNDSKGPVRKPEKKGEPPVEDSTADSGKFGPHCPHYVERTFMSATHFNIKSIIRYMDRSDIYLIYKEDGELDEKDLLEFNIPENDITTLREDKVCVVTGDIKFVIGRPERFSEVISDYNKPVHLAVYTKDGLLSWRKSSAGAALTRLKAHILSDMYTDYKMSYDKPVTIIYSDYGMGKTEVLYQISRSIINIDKKAIIKFIDYRQLQAYILSQEEGTRTVKNFMEFFEIDLNNTNIHLMIDNFEETDSYNTFLKMLNGIQKKYSQNVRLWITCSKAVVKDYLEDSLATLSCVLTPLNDAQQIKYLTDCFSGNKEEPDHKLFPYTLRLIIGCNKFYWKKFINSKNLGYKFTSYPLHLRMIANVCHPSDLNDIRIYNADIPTLLEIYDSYVRTSNAAVEEQLQNLAVEELHQICGKVFKLNQMNEGLKKYLENRYLIEYIVAVYARDNIEVFKDVLNLGCTTWFFFHMFNRIACVLNDLHTAVMNDDVKYIKENVNDENIIETDEFGRTLLHLAVSTQMVNILMRKGINAEIRDNILSWSALNYYDYRTFLSGIEILLCNYVNAKDLDFIFNKATYQEKSRRLSTALALNLEHTVFHLLNLKDEKTKDGVKKVNRIKITPKNIYEAIKYLRPAPAFTFVTMIPQKKYDKFKHQGIIRDALRVAIQRSCNEAFMYLLKTVKCDYLFEYPEGMTLFRYACKYKNMELIEFLDCLRKRNLKDGWKLYLVLQDCCETDNIEVLMYLFNNHTIDVTKNFSSGKSPLELACLHKSERVACKIFYKLIGYTNCDPLLTMQMLKHAVYCPCLPLINFILAMNKEININEKIKFPLVHMACKLESTETLLLLLKYKADVNLLNENEQTPLFDAHHSKNVDMVKILIKSNCNINHIDKNGENVLHHYIKVFKDIYLDSLRAMIQLLVDEGANIFQLSKDGKTPLILAEELNTTSIYEVLITSRQHKTEYRYPIVMSETEF